jgi:nucleoside-diphosphate-sugar epimerase
MRIFVAGATGTLGQPALRALGARGHQVVGLSRTESGAKRIRGMGARAVVGNALDSQQLNAAVAESNPEVVVHLLTALPAGGVLRKSQLRPTNELRIKGTANLIAASVAAGARRIVAESFVGIYGAGHFDEPASEETPLPSPPPGAFTEAIRALRSLEDQLQTASASSALETVALRIGLLYGSSVPSTRVMIEQARAGRMFLPTGLAGIGPFVHIDDATTAIVAAVESPNPSSVYNVVDDQPMSMSDFVSQLLAAAGAPPPRSIPPWVVKIAAPVIAALASARLPLDNSKAKRELHWEPRYPTVRAGLTELRANFFKAA